MAFEGKHAKLTEMVIGAFYKVYNQLGYGFSEKVYENALAIQLRNEGMDVLQQAGVNVYFAGILVGEFFVDLLVNQTVIVELKAVHHILEEHEAQLLNYLKASEIEVGLLLNFGPTAQVRRKIFDNSRKGTMTWIKEETSRIHINKEKSVFIRRIRIQKRNPYATEPATPHPRPNHPHSGRSLPATA